MIPLITALLALGTVPYTCLAADDDDWALGNPLEEFNQEEEAPEPATPTSIEELFSDVRCGTIVAELNRMPNPDEVDADGNNLLHIVVQRNDAHTRTNINTLVETHGYAVNATNAAGQTPLEVAILFHNDVAVQALLNLHANINHTNQEGLTMLELGITERERLNGGRPTRDIINEAQSQRINTILQQNAGMVVGYLEQRHAMLHPEAPTEIIEEIVDDNDTGEEVPLTESSDDEVVPEAAVQTTAPSLLNGYLPVITGTGAAAAIAVAGYLMLDNCNIQ